MGQEAEDLKSHGEILKLVWPLALGMINNAVMQFVDRAYLANDSMRALEAVLPAGMLMWMFAGFFQSVVGYSSVFVGRYHGAGDVGKCRMTYRVSLVLAALFGVTSLALLPVGNAILRATVVSAELLQDEVAYFNILMCGSFGVYGQMAAAAYFTGRGKTRIVFWANLMGNVLNIALDPILIFGWWGVPRLGIAGAAYATAFAMVVQMVILMVAARRETGDARREVGGREAGDARWGEMAALCGRILRFGVPAGLYTVLNMLSFTIFVFVTGGVGDLELAVSNACFTVNYLLIAPMEGFALGASTLVAQALGRGDAAAAAGEARRTIALGVGFVAVCSAVVLLLAHPILEIFASRAGDSSEAFHSLGFTLFALMAAWQVFDAADVILSGALKGGGDTKFVLWWMLVVAFAIWLPLVFAVRHFHNTMPALWATMIVYVVIICVGSVVRWRRGRWKDMKLT